jgi:hypothetical protein
VDAGAAGPLHDVMNRGWNGGTPPILLADEGDAVTRVGRFKDQLGDFSGEQPRAAQLDLFTNGLLVLKNHVVLPSKAGDGTCVKTPPDVSGL